MSEEYTTHYGDGMREGMLWFDNSGRDLIRKIENAALYYESKYEEKPDLCFVHPSMLHAGLPDTIGGMTVRGTVSVLPNHFWVGKSGRSA